MDSCHDTNAIGRDQPVTQPQDPKLFSCLSTAFLLPDGLPDIAQRIDPGQHFGVGSRGLKAVPEAFEKSSQQYLPVLGGGDRAGPVPQ